MHWICLGWGCPHWGIIQKSLHIKRQDIILLIPWKSGEKRRKLVSLLLWGIVLVGILQRCIVKNILDMLKD